MRQGEPCGPTGRRRVPTDRNRRDGGIEPQRLEVSALLAARVIARAAGDYGAGRLASYDELLERRFGPRGGERARSRPIAGLRAALARRLLPREWFARRVVIDRWFLHRGRGA